jgi:hypothetical protein
MGELSDLGYREDVKSKVAGEDVPPLESMADAMKRLRTEKRWKEFCSLRSDYKNKEGLSAEESFYRALGYFPPILQPQPELPEVLSKTASTQQERDWKKKHEAQLQAKLEKKLAKVEKERQAQSESHAAVRAEQELEALAVRSKEATFAGDFEWAYQNIGNSSVEAKDAPSGGAWFMLEYGREARAKFMEMALRFFSRAGREATEDRVIIDDHREKLAVCDKLLQFQGGEAPRPAWERGRDSLG